MSTIIKGSTYQPTPDTGEGGAAFVGIAGFVAIAYFWETIVWAFAATYSSITVFVGTLWSWAAYAVQATWSAAIYIASIVYGVVTEFISAVLNVTGSALGWFWSSFSGLALEIWSAVIAVAILLWTASTIALGPHGWSSGMLWNHFGIYLLFGLGAGIVVGILQHAFRVRSRYVAEVIKAAGTPDVITAARLGTVNVVYTIGISLALSVALAAIGLVVPYLLGGMQSPIAPGGPLELAVAGGAGGFGGSGGFGGGSLDLLSVVFILCGLVILIGVLVGALFSGALSVFVSGIASGAASALKAGAPLVGHSLGHAIGANLVYGLTRSFARSKHLTRQMPVSPDSSQPNSSAVIWSLHAIRSGIATGIAIAILFALWLSSSLLLQGIL